MRHLSAPVSTCQHLSAAEQFEQKHVFSLTQQFDIQSVSPIGIDQGDNQLTELSAAMLRHLPLLEQLLLGGKRDEEGRVIVQGNRIKKLGTIFGRNEQLQVIDFSENLLQKIDPATFAGLKKLRWLSLESNQLTTLPAGAFQGLDQLQHLNLRYNELTTIPTGTFQDLGQLQELDLSSNELTTIPAEIFQGLGQLQELNLKYNQLMTIPVGAFQGLGQLQELNRSTC